MRDIVLEEAWRREDPAQAEAARIFWARHGLLAPADAEARVGELVALARIGGQVAAVSTASITPMPRLGARLAMYRCAVAPEFRKLELAEAITAYSRQALERWSIANPGAGLMGMGAIIQADELRGSAARPIWSESGIHLNFVSYTASGDQFRIAWFEHARLEPPGP